MGGTDPDTEFNALSALYSSVVADMKSSYPAWEGVGAKAAKLSLSLRATVTALASFNDAVQGVSDLANNLKGASRDVGACVTRICMRQRALEGRMKSLADALADELAVSVASRTSFWKGRTAEMDKAHGRHVKKVRGNKKRPDESVVAAQRNLAAQLLLEQRAQFGFFVSALMPVLSAEVALLDEASHIRPAVETLEETTRGVDGDALVNTVLCDLTQNGLDGAWRTRLPESTSTASGIGSCNGSIAADRPGSRIYESGDCRASSHSGGASSVDASDLTPVGGHPPGRMQMIPPSSMMIMNQRQALQQLGKPPMGRRLSAASMPTAPPTPSSASGSPPDSGTSFAPTPSLSSFRGIGLDPRPTRPQSFAGDIRNPSYANNPLATPTVYGSGMNYAAGSTFSVPSSGCGGSSTGSGGVIIEGGPLSQQHSSSCSSSEAAASAMAETLQQIDRLGAELEGFTASGIVTGGVGGSEYACIDGMRPAGPVRIRPGSSVDGGPRPPPPERRSSQITSANSHAPSIADARLSSSGLRGSRQSLNSNPSSSSVAPYNLCQPPAPPGPPSSFRHPGLTNGTGHYAAPTLNPYAMHRPHFT